MRYFTRHWYNRIQAHFFDDAFLTEEESNGPSSAYHAHLARIGQHLPTDLLFLATHISMNDGLFKDVVKDQAAQQLDLRLRCGDHPSGYFDLKLIYRGATLLTEPKIGLNALVNNTEYEVLNEEVDINDSGLYEHRMLLWPEGEIAISFSTFTFTRTTVPDRYAP